MVSQQFVYDRAISRYRHIDTRQPVNSVELIRILNEDQLRLKNELGQLAVSLIRGQTDLSDLEASALDITKFGMIRAMTLGAGGKQNLNRSPSRRRFIRQLEVSLEGVVQSLDRTINAVLDSQLTADQFRARMQRLSLEVFPAFSRSEIVRVVTEQGFNESMRSRDPSLRRSPPCIGLNTGGDWVPIFETVAIGHGCFATGACRCKLSFRFNPKKPRVTREGLDRFVETSARRPVLTEAVG